MIVCWFVNCIVSIYFRNFWLDSISAWPSYMVLVSCNLTLLIEMRISLFSVYVWQMNVHFYVSIHTWISKIAYSLLFYVRLVTNNSYAHHFVSTFVNAPLISNERFSNEFSYCWQWLFWLGHQHVSSWFLLLFIDDSNRRDIFPFSLRLFLLSWQFICWIQVSILFWGF